MPSIIEANAAKAAARFTGGVPVPHRVNNFVQGSQPSASWGNYVSNFVSNFRVEGGQMAYNGKNATLTIPKQNAGFQCSRNLTTLSVLNISEGWGYDADIDGPPTPAWSQVSDGTAVVAGFTSGTYYCYVQFNQSGTPRWSITRTTAGAAKPVGTTSPNIDKWILAEVVAVSNQITTIKQWWQGGMAIYQHRL